MLLEIDGSVSTLSCRSDKSSSHIEQQQKLNKELQKVTRPKEYVPSAISAVSEHDSTMILDNGINQSRLQRVKQRPRRKMRPQHLDTNNIYPPDRKYAQANDELKSPQKRRP
jgi:hypothetical protein